MDIIMNEKVWLFYENSSRITGPGKVATNLTKGLQNIDVEVVNQPRKADYLGCLQHPGSFIDFLPENTLMGPNLFVLPPEAPELCQKFNNFVVPSKWVKDKYLTYPQMKGKKIYPWPVGIDTEEYKEDKLVTPKYDFFIYLKNTYRGVAEEVRDTLTLKMGLSYGGIVSYGNYEPEDLKALCHNCKFAVLITDTESQGIAYMEILSTNTPCVVFNKKTWVYQNNSKITAAATSVPYFDDRCGIKLLNKGIKSPVITEEEAKEIDQFLFNLKKGLYKPREYILENHTLEISAREYMRILQKGDK